MSQFQTIGRTFILILPKAANLLLVLVCVMYLFSAVGMACFGGLINTDPDSPWPSDKLVGTAFEDALYYPNNFNDMLSGQC